MCGIAGIMRRRTRVDEREILRMSELLRHRGPDDEGHILLRTGWDATLPGSDGGGDAGMYDLALANRRLAILDLSPLGHQPMTRNGHTIVYNGEVYNYIELRRELSVLGYCFTSTSDTEVILNAYIEWGWEALTKFNGIFAFAIWSEPAQTLFCARDRLGVKPFYYRMDEPSFVFASEIKSILSVLDRAPGLDETLVYDFLTADRVDHTDGTFFQEIRKLPAGCFLRMSSSATVLQRYWRLDSGEGNADPPERNIERFRELFTDAVHLQMRSDVPVACCLSGGMDSSAIVTVAAQQTGYPMETFTARYADASMDEFRYARMVVQKSGVHTTPLVVTPRQYWDDLPAVVRSQEEPFGGPSIYSQWLLMKTINSHHIKVVLDGQGGDELLCGYAKYFYHYLAELWNAGRYPALVRTGLLALSNAGSHIFNFREGKRYLPEGLRGRSTLLQPWFLEMNNKRNGTIHADSVRSLQALDVEKYSLPVLLRFEDKNSMAHSVESRVPFLDHRLVEFAVGLPTGQKLYGAKSKLVLREALGHLLPREVLARRSKLGFGGSFRSWVAELTPQLTQWVGSRTLPVERYVQRGHMCDLIRQRDPRIFSILVMNLWLNEFDYR